MSSPRKPSQAPAGGTHARPAAGAQQLGLLPAESLAARDGLMPIPQAATSRSAPRGAGRPEGSRDRRTDLMAQYLVQRYGDPLEADVAFGTMPLNKLIPALRTLASECGMSMGDITISDLLRMQAECRGRALPFIHAKRAPEDHKGDPVLPIIGIGTLAMQINTTIEGGRSIEDVLHDQGVSETEPNKSHDGKSHDDTTD